jgi:dTDP-4-amino-4,6-dideoxygalactose transaminase
MNLFSPNPRFRIYTSFSFYLSILSDVLLGRVNKGNECLRVENEIKTKFQVANAICTPQARMGIYLAIKAIVKPGQKIILSPYTIADVINMVICAGAKPVFADIDSKSCNIDPAEVEKLIDDNTCALMVTHLHGLSCQMESFTEICKSHNLLLIEDAAQSFGAKLNGRFVGSFGDAGIYSFGMYKNITAFFGGMVVTPHQEIYEKIYNEISLFPYTEAGSFLKKMTMGLATGIATSSPAFQLLIYHIFRFGHLHNIKAINRFVETELDLSRKDSIPEKYLRRMTPMQARLLLLRLNKVERDNAIRIRYAEIYHEGLADLPKIALPPLRTDGSHIYTYYPIQFHDRASLIRWMMKHYRDVGKQHLKNCADLPAFKEYYRDCPKARKTAEETILLPTYPRYTEEEVQHNIKTIRAFFGKR